MSARLFKNITILSVLVTTVLSMEAASFPDFVDTDACPQTKHEHRVENLPYFDATKGMPCMYASNMKSSDKYNNFFFYWLFPKPDQSTADTPLIMYMNGGPGSTSMNALFTENGPMRVE